MRFLSFLLLGILLLSCEPKDLPTVKVLESERAILKLSHQSTKTEMEEYARDLNRNLGIKFDFTQSLFFDNGLLRSLNFQIVNPDGSGGRAAADLMNLQHSYVGFIVELDGQGGTSYIKTGILE